MDISSAFTYMKNDENLMMKLLIGGLIMLVVYFTSGFLVGIVLLFPYYGYWLHTMTQVRDGRPIPLPEWGNWGDLFSKGGMIFVIALVYNLPVLLFTCCIGALFIPIMIAPEMAEDILPVVGIMFACLSCIFSIIMTLANIMLPAAWIRYAQTEQISSAFEFKEILAFIRNNIADYLIVIVMSWVVSFIASFGIILCGIGVFFTGFWGTLVTAHLYGQLAAKMNGIGNIPETEYIGL